MCKKEAMNITVGLSVYFPIFLKLVRDLWILIRAVAFMIFWESFTIYDRKVSVNSWQQGVGAAIMTDSLKVFHDISHEFRIGKLNLYSSTKVLFRADFAFSELQNVILLFYRYQSFVIRILKCRRAFRNLMLGE